MGVIRLNTIKDMRSRRHEEGHTSNVCHCMFVVIGKRYDCIHLHNNKFNHEGQEIEPQGGVFILFFLYFAGMIGLKYR